MSFNTFKPPINESSVDFEDLPDIDVSVAPVITLPAAISLAHAYCFYLKEKKEAEKLARRASSIYTALLMFVFLIILRGRNLKCETCYYPRIIVLLLFVPCFFCMVYLLLQRYKHALWIIVFNRWIDEVCNALATNGVTVPEEIMYEIAITEREKHQQIWGEKLFLAVCMIYMLVWIAVVAATCDWVLCIEVAPSSSQP